MSEKIKVFFIEPLAKCRVSLRRYQWDKEKSPKCLGSYHDSETVIGEIDVPLEQRLTSGDPTALKHQDNPLNVSREDHRWPSKCESCDYIFDINDDWQINYNRLYASQDNSIITTLREAPVGAMWDASWLSWQKGPDGLSLNVRLPDGRVWCVDSQANNCTRKGETHYCWIRHGDPKTGEIHVDKNGDSCAAGAGSIQTEGWHGFLHNGYLVQC